MILQPNQLKKMHDLGNKIAVIDSNKNDDANKTTVGIV